MRVGTRRKVATWYIRRPGEFVVIPPGWRKNDPGLVFTKQSQMLEFARASRLMLKQVGMAREMGA